MNKSRNNSGTFSSDPFCVIITICSRWDCNSRYACPGGSSKNSWRARLSYENTWKRARLLRPNCTKVVHSSAPDISEPAIVIISTDAESWALATLNRTRLSFCAWISYHCNHGNNYFRYTNNQRKESTRSDSYTFCFSVTWHMGAVRGQGSAFFLKKWISAPWLLA